MSSKYSISGPLNIHRATSPVQKNHTNMAVRPQSEPHNDGNGVVRETQRTSPMWITAMEVLCQRCLDRGYTNQPRGKR
jgi:DnaJ-class molecular chaperone